MDLKINGTSCTFHGTIGPLSSDNLGAHCIGGFVESFNSLRICRVCMGTSNDIQTKVCTCTIIRELKPSAIQIVLHFQWSNNRGIYKLCNNKQDEL